MQVTSLLSQREEHEGHHHHDHDHEHGESCASCGHEHDHDHATLPLAQTITGLIFVINSFVVTWFLSGGTEIFQSGSAFGALTANPIAAASAMIGAIILGYPIVWTAVKDLRRGVLTTNELVALAVLASFGSGHYQEAGVVAFFMLLGQIIETRTAEGARASIESLIELTPGQGPPHHRHRRGGSPHQPARHRGRHPRPPWRQRGRRRHHR